MEMEARTNDTSEEAVFQFGDGTDAATFEIEKCGICMDIIIDRGVLDCCNHWFCFACIDNWATITNLCPLCKNEFQLITCIPVYDTIGSIKGVEDSLSRDDDWSIQGNNNTLSFPSYYIDEDAVICLDGDGCKLRSGLATTEEDSTLDTSIACDSCDIWYHAFCVGFDTESASESSWLCPRCTINEVPQKSGGIKTQASGEQCSQGGDDLELSVEPAFSGKVSVAVADTGETAMVVSMVEEKQMSAVDHDIPSDIRLNANEDGKHGPSLSDPEAHSSKLETGKTECVIQPNIDSEENSLVLSLSRDVSSFSHGDSFHHTDTVDKPMSKPSGSDRRKISPSLSLNTFCSMSGLSESDSNLDLQLGLCVGSSIPVEKIGSSITDNQVAGDAERTNAPEETSSPADNIGSKNTDNQVAGDAEQKNSSEETPLPVDHMAIDASENIGGDRHWKILEVSGVKRKHTEKSRDGAHMNDYTGHKERERHVKMEPEVPTKKARSDGKSQTISLKHQIDTSVASDGSQGYLKPVAGSQDKIRHTPEKEVAASDIMNIVRGADRRVSKRPACLSSRGRAAEERDRGGRLRIKKIMRRVADDKESSMLVQKLRQEIREAVCDKTSIESETFDVKLLAAFRTATAKLTEKPVAKASPPLVRTKKLVLLKGKTRENLTKKIYGTTSGRRRRAWDRDREVEFWKHRCAGTKADNVETLQSILDLLRRNIDSCSGSLEKQREPPGKTKESLLSRLYLADTSVFPRNEDIKPLSAITGRAMVDNREQNASQTLANTYEKSKPVSDNKKVEFSAPIVRTSSQRRVPSSDSTGKGGKVPSFKGEAAYTKAPQNVLKRGPTSNCMSSGLKVNSLPTKESPGTSDDVKSDKRKWALEVLARKSALISKDTSQQTQEENTTLKRNYPLLAQLPIDMRPTLATIRHSKVTASIRQAHLYRLTEHYLRKANPSVVHRSADTELAVADAVNVEKDICERSNSKLVYTNLCSQVLSQRTNNSKPRSVETDDSSLAMKPSEGAEQEVREAPSDVAEKCMNAEQALKLAGLLSDSPPSSPCQVTNDLSAEDEQSEMVGEEGFENVFDVDSHLELDIYGDFEYDLENEDYVEPSSMSTALRGSNLQPGDGDCKMKVVFSTLVPENEWNGVDSRDGNVEHVNSQKERESDCHKRLGNVESQMDSPSKDRGTGSLILAPKTASQCPSQEPFQGEMGEEPSLAECEELYGPDKEPLINKISKNVLSDPNKYMEKEATAESIIPGENENCKLDKAAVVHIGNFHVDHNSSGRENSPNHSLMCDNVQRKEAKSNSNQQSDLCHSISRKVEAYIKEHVRPLCKSGVITVEQYRWAVGKTTDKVMKFHCKAKNANFLIKEGEKVKRLAEQYVEAAKEKQ